MTMIELTAEELQAVAGGQNHGQATTDAVRFAQNYVYTTYGSPSGPPPGIMGTEVSYFARHGLIPA
jgi:hypothetical protein